MEDEELVKQKIEEMRPPPEIRGQLDIGYCYENNLLEIFEIRPQFTNEVKINHFPFAKVKFIQSKNIWKLYWKRANGKWELYKPLPEVINLREFFRIINEDEYGAFKG